MKKNNITLKKELPLPYKALMTKRIADSFFTYDEKTGETEYTPFYREMGEILAFAQIAVDGLEFEDGENIYEAVKSDAELMGLYQDYKTNMEYMDIFFDARDIVEFRKQQLLNAQANDQSSTITTLLSDLIKKELENQDLQKQILEQQKEINSQYTKEETTHIIEILDMFNKNKDNPEFLKAFASAVHNDNTIKSLQDHKKKTTPKKKTKTEE